jgi:PAS domain-containing protein
LTNALNDKANEGLKHMNTHLIIQQLRKELEAKNAALQQEIAKRKQTEETLQQAYKELEQQVAERTAEFARANARLQAEITERKQIEETLKTSETRYRELFTHMSSGVAVYEAVKNGQDFIFKDFNQAGERIENIRKDDLIGKSVLEMFPGVKDFGLF